MNVDRRTFLKLAASAAAAPACGHAGPPRVASPVPYRRLARRIHELAPRYDVIVVGSGYGGSVLAARLAAGRRLALLERGAEWPPGSFPERLGELTDQLRTRHRPLGLFDVRAFSEVSVIVGSGLGGTSLINANVVIEPDPDVFDHGRWPVEIRRARDDGRLVELYDVVARMLQAAPYPGDPLPRMDAFERGVAAARGRPHRALQAVNFDRYDGVANHVGVVQNACTRCGNCVSGCNVAAKNTLNFNYLPLARRNGAAIFTGIEVHWIEKRASGGYRVHATYHPPRGDGNGDGDGDGDGDGPRALAVDAGAVVLGAGTLGSTEILLRSRARGLAVSDALGEGLSGNADTLAVAYNSDRRTDAVGFGTRRPGHADVGPTITTIGDFRQGGRVPLGERFLIEDAAIPSGLVGLLLPVVGLVPAGEAGASPDAARQRARARRGRLDYGSFDPDGALNHSVVLLGMGNDPAAARIYLDERGALAVDWKAETFRPTAERIVSRMRAVAGEFGGILIVDPLSRGWLDRDVTVHPLGGCAMADDARGGVVDHLGRVFDPTPGGDALHRGLYVVCGATLPTAAGVNPLLTISALAERIAARAAQELEPTAT